MKANISRIDKLKPREYTLFDCIKLPFTYAPVQVLIFIIINISFAILPVLTVIATARFIDVAISVASGDIMRSQAVLPLLALLGLYGYSRVMRCAKDYVDIRTCIQPFKIASRTCIQPKPIVSFENG